MIRVAILFGGSSREREVSFSGGRTVYDNLDKSLFEAIPVFVDSFNKLTVLDWSYVYKGSIRDFYPPVEFLPESPNAFQIYAESIGEELADDMRAQLGKPIQIEELKGLCDFVFLALHGKNAEDGTIQGILEWLEIPYSGSGIFASAFGLNKRIQKVLFDGNQNWQNPNWISLAKKDWVESPQETLDALKNRPFPLVVKAATQGSSIGISVLDQFDENEVANALNKSFFIQEIKGEDWLKLSAEERVLKLRSIVDIREGIGMPLLANNEQIRLPEELLKWLNNHFSKGAEMARLEALDGEFEVVIESFIEGREFSCIVIQDLDGKPVALPPTEIVKGKDLFDYRSKYLPGLSRKITPIDLSNEEIQRIREACEAMFLRFSFNVYARIDGFYGKDKSIYLNDPNTTSGMMPSSFFFHQAAEIGLSPSDFLTYIIKTSLSERARTSGKPNPIWNVLNKVEENKTINNTLANKKKVAVIMGGYSTERHISVESGRNIFEKLSSSLKYDPIPVFLEGSDESYRLHLLPINMMLKDNADDIREKILHYKPHPFLKRIQDETQGLRNQFKRNNAVLEPIQVSFEELAERVDMVFIALHGRPGEDGSLQKHLERVGLPYNGSGIESSNLTINKYLTNRILEKNGFSVAKACLVEEREWRKDKSQVMKQVRETCGFPLIAKPADDGCSSAVKKIKNESELEAYAELIFREKRELDLSLTSQLDIDPKEEIPMKSFFLAEEHIGAKGAAHFIEITGGLLTHRDNQGLIQYEIFEASESLAEKGILSLAEKFLAGQGQNITPARYDKDPAKRQKLSDMIKSTFEKAARTLNIEGYARIDAFVRIFSESQVEVVFIEVNSLPGMTPATCIFHQTAIQGYTPYEFIDRILEYGQKRISKNE